MADNALGRLKGRQQRRGWGDEAPPSKHLASASHVENDKYMADFEAAWEEMNGVSISPAPKVAPSGLPLQKSRASLPSRYPSKTVQGWVSGPISHEGDCIDLSDRPTVCSAADWAAGEVVVGSTDHALYVIDAITARKIRKLYGKADGHAEWVSCVTYLPDGSIVSGGMDSKLCYWAKGSSRATDLKGHSGPISQVGYDVASGTIISASYDKSIRLWSVVGRGGREVACLDGSAAPVLEIAPDGDGQLLSGDRSGNVMLWDLGRCESTWAMKSVHKGHVTALAWVDGSGGNEAWSGCFVSGGQDGCLRVWDPRQRANPVKLALHVNDQGHGAVTGIIAGGPSASYMCATCGADGSVRVLDPRGSMAELTSIQLSDFPYSFAAAGGLVLAGCGDGSLHVIDLATLETLYALGANKHAVRTIEASKDRLVCSGDDGNVIVYRFE